MTFRYSVPYFVKQLCLSFYGLQKLNICLVCHSPWKRDVILTSTNIEIVLVSTLLKIKYFNILKKINIKYDMVCIKVIVQFWAS